MEIKPPVIKWVDADVKFKTWGFVGKQRFITIMWDPNLRPGIKERYKIISWLPGLKVKGRHKRFETEEKAIEEATTLFNKWIENMYIV